MHSWGDDWPHWQELYAANHWISDYVYKWSWCRLQSKEKWGSLRYEYVWPPTLKRNGPVIRVPFLVKKINFGDGKVLNGHYYILYWTNSWLYYKWMAYGTRVLRRAVKKACLKFPNVVKEITEDLEWQ